MQNAAPIIHDFSDDWGSRFINLYKKMSQLGDTKDTVLNRLKEKGKGYAVSDRFSINGKENLTWREVFEEIRRVF